MTAPTLHSLILLPAKRNAFGLRGGKVLPFRKNIHWQVLSQIISDIYFFQFLPSRFG